jgi:NAD(P)-dependent dehydrogenase (short-subunit alcohol dehydrogenase family)
MVEAQYTDFSSLKVRANKFEWRSSLTDSFQNAAETVKKITGGSLDYLINNAAVVSHISGYKTFEDLSVVKLTWQKKKCWRCV